MRGGGFLASCIDNISDYIKISESLILEHVLFYGNYTIM